MQNLFPGYYRPSDQDFSEMWKSCIFAFDTSVLLNLHQYPSETLTIFFDILIGLKDRIYMPYQVAEEYHRNRLEAVTEQIKLYNDLDHSLNTILKRVEASPGLFPALEEINTKIYGLMKVFQDTKPIRSSLLSQDDITLKLADIFSNNIGQPYSKSDLVRIYKEGEQRFSEEIPPGYEDKKNKTGNRMYGDLVLWFQLIALAKSKEKPIIFVTDEKKPDWWLKDEKGILNPRIELIQEMLLEANVSFYMYRSKPFMDFAQSFLKMQIDPEVIKEIEQVNQQIEEREEIEELIQKANEEEIIQQAILSDYTEINSLGELMRTHAAFEAAWRRLTPASSLDALLRKQASYDIAFRRLTQPSAVEEAIREQAERHDRLSRLTQPSAVTTWAREQAERHDRLFGLGQPSAVTTWAREQAERHDRMLRLGQPGTVEEAIRKQAALDETRRSVINELSENNRLDEQQNQALPEQTDESSTISEDNIESSSDD